MGVSELKGYTIQMLGSFFCLYDQKPLKKIPTGKQQLIFAFLLLHSDVPLNKKQLAFQFWPDSTEQQALTNLRKILFELKKILPAADDHLDVKDGHITWYSNERCLIDVLEFEKKINSQKQSDLKQALDAYQGEFLPGYYDDWIIERREKLSMQYAALLKKMIMLHEQKREFDDAIAYAIRYLQLDRLSEFAHMTIARLHIMNGNLSAARKQFLDMETILRSELDVAPSDEVIKTFEKLLNDENIRSGDYVRKHSVPMIGRKKEWELLLQAWEKASRGVPLLVILEGEAGIGKTRLAEEFSLWAASQGIQTYSSRCYPSGESLPYEPVMNWLEKIIVDHLDKGSLTELSRIIPTLKERYPDLPTPEPLREPGQIRNWFNATEMALLQNKPTVLILDDIQWSDKETIKLVEYFLRTDQSSPLIILGTIRTGTIHRNSYIQEFLDSLYMRRQLIQITLELFTAEETELMVKSLSEKNDLLLRSKQIHDQSGGNPLFISEITRSVETASYQNGYGSNVLSIMARRLADLSESVQRLIGLLTVLGKPASVPFLSSVAKSSDQTVENLEQLLQMRILRRLENGLFDFYHDQWREAARLRINESRIQLLHGMVAKAMEMNDSKHRFTSAEIAYHLEKAGYENEAVPYYEKAVMEAKEIYAHDKVVQYCSKLLPYVEKQKQLQWLTIMAEAFRLSGKWSEAEKAYRKWLELCDYSVSLEQKALHEVALGNCLRLQGKYHDALYHLDRSIHIFEMLDHQEGLIEAYGNLGIVYQYIGEYDSAIRYLKKCIDPGTETQQEGKFAGIMGNIYYEKNRYEEALHYYKLQIRIANRNNNLSSLTQAFGGMGLVYIELNEFERAFHSFGEQLQLSRSLSDRNGIANSIGKIGKTFLHAGYDEEAYICVLYCLHEALIIGDVRVVAITLGLLGHILDRKNSNENALWALQHARRIGESLNIPFFTCDTLYYLGNYFFRRKRWKEAEDFLLKVLPITKKLDRNDLSCQAEVILVRSRIYLGSVTIPEAVSQLKQLFQLKPGEKERAFIHHALWEISGDEEHLQKTKLLVKDLYRKSPVPFYERWAANLGIELSEIKSLQFSVPSVPREVLQRSFELEDLIKSISKLRIH